LIELEDFLEKTSVYNGPLLVDEPRNQNREELKKSVEDLLRDKSIIGVVNKKKGVESRRLKWQKSLSSQVLKLIELVDVELLGAKG
jgi:hypothetical protein